MYSLRDITHVCSKLEPHSSPEETENHDQDYVTDHVESQGAMLPFKTEALDCTQRKLDCEAVAKENGSANVLSDHEVSSSDQPIKSHKGFDGEHSIECIYNPGTHGEMAGHEISAYQIRAVHQKSYHDTRLSHRMGTRGIQDTWLPYHPPTDQSEAFYHQGVQGTMSPYDFGKDQTTVYQGATPRALHYSNSNRATQATALPNGTSSDHAAVYQGITQGSMSHQGQCQGSTQGAVTPHYDVCSYRTLTVPQRAMAGYYINTSQELHSGTSAHKDIAAYGEKRLCCSCHVTKFPASHFPAFGEQHQRPSVIMVPTKWRETEPCVWTPKVDPSTLYTIPKNQVFQPELQQRQVEESNYSDSSDGGEDEANEEKYFRKSIDGTTAKFKLSKEDWERIPINTFPSGGRLLSGDWTQIFLRKVKESNPWCSLRFKNNHVRSENSRKIHSAVFFRGGAECKRPECNVKVRFVIRKEKGKYVDVTYVGDVCHSSQPGGIDVRNANRRSKRVHKPRILED